MNIIDEIIDENERVASQCESFKSAFKTGDVKSFENQAHLDWHRRNVMATQIAIRELFPKGIPYIRIYKNEDEMFFLSIINGVIPLCSKVDGLVSFNSPLGGELVRRYNELLENKTSNLGYKYNMKLIHIFNAIVEKFKIKELYHINNLKNDILKDKELFDEFDIKSSLNEEFEKPFLDTVSSDVTDISNTISISQNDLFRSDPTSPLLITGMPGSGKTSVALMRVAWLVDLASEEAFPNSLPIVEEEILFIAREPYLRNRIKKALGEEFKINKVLVEEYGQWATITIANLKRINRVSARLLTKRSRNVDTEKIKIIESHFSELVGEFSSLFNKPNISAEERRSIPYIYFKCIKKLYGISAADGEYDDYDLSVIIYFWNHVDYYRSNKNIWGVNDKGNVNSSDRINGYLAPTKYTHIVLDEAQLYPLYWLRAIETSIIKNGGITYCGDQNQSVGELKSVSLAEYFSTKSDGQIAELNAGYRWSPKIFEYLNDVSQTLNIIGNIQKPKNVEDKRKGKVIYHRVKQSSSIPIFNCIVGIVNANFNKSILVTLPKNSTTDHYLNLKNKFEESGIVSIVAEDPNSLISEVSKVCLSNPQFVIGMEYDIVISIKPEQIEEDEVLWTLLTRGKEELHLISDSNIDTRLESKNIDFS